MMFKKLVFPLICLCVGVLVGGYLFNQSQPRSFLALNECERCLEPNDLLGLMGSIGMQKLPGLLPSVVYETDRSVVMMNPLPNASKDYVIIPKRDIKHAGDISVEDMPYLVDAYQVAGYLMRSKAISSYRFYTNGPDVQDVTYLHFHLVDLGTNEGSEPSPFGLLMAALKSLPQSFLAMTPAAKHDSEVEAPKPLPVTPPLAPAQS